MVWCLRVYPSDVQCLYEAQNVGSCASVFAQSNVEYDGQECSTPFDAYATGYSIDLYLYIRRNADLTWNDFWARDG